MAESRSRYELLTRATNDAVWEWDIAASRAWWNERVYLILGFEPGAVEPSFDAWANRLHPEDRQRILDSFRAVMSSDRETWSETYRFVRADGSLRYAMDRGVIERAADGAPLRIIGSMTDITERVLAEQALRESEATLRQLTDAIREVFWLAEPDGSRIHYVSPAWEALWGRPCQDVIDNPAILFDSIHPDDRGRVEAAIRHKQDIFDQTYRIVRPDGSIAWVHDRGYPIRNASGEIVRVAGLVTDVTAEHAIEARLTHANRLDSAGRLAGSLAHDFGNMLMVVMAGTQTAANRLPEGHPARADLRDVAAAAERAAELTRQLLIFTRQQPTNPAAVDLNTLLRRLESMLSHSLGSHIELVLSLADAPMLAWVDEAQMEQVIVNLAINARDAMPEGGMLELRSSPLHLNVICEDWDLPRGRYVTLAVRDTGTGISPEVRSHLFEPFFTTKAPGRGTGLGLATCYGVVRKAGGDIRVTSEWGRGSTFEIALPYVANAALTGARG